ncbi:MAG: hypothetical protein OHK0024_26740 [Thalassobaculales bacterium]
MPPGHALWIPAGLAHDVTMLGAVGMRTAYVAAPAAAAGQGARVIRVSPLLQAVLLALAEEPLAEEPLAGEILAEEASPADGQGGRPAARLTHLSALALDEIARAPVTPLALPLPADPRLAGLCRALIAEPALSLDLDGWAERVALSRRSLSRRFRAETGLSLGQWRARLRALGALAGATAPALGYRSQRALKAMVRRQIG